MLHREEFSKQSPILFPVVENGSTTAKDGLVCNTIQLTRPSSARPKQRKTRHYCRHGAHSYCNPVDYCLRYLYLKDVYICKYEQKVAIILGAVQLLITDWGCHFAWCLCVCACVFVVMYVCVFYVR